jgi:hemolysin activation/secretion protein
MYVSFQNHLQHVRQIPMKLSICTSAARLALLPAVLAILPAAGFAVDKPNAGDLMRQVPQINLQPPALSRVQVLPREQAEAQGLALPANLKLALKSVRFTGAKSFTNDELMSQLGDVVGHELDFAQLQGLAGKITDFYRRQGFVLARAFLPAQRIENAVVEIVVVEGKLGRVNIEAAAPLDPEKLRPYLAGIKEGEPLRSEPLEAGLLRLSDLPGVRVQSVLRPGQSVGTTDLDIQVVAGQTSTANASLDNYGSRSTGRFRLNGRYTLSNSLSLGDSLDVNLSTAGGGMNYGRLAYQQPVGGSGSQLGLAVSALHYKLGKDFAALGASGTATDLTLYGLTSLVRSRLVSAQAQTSLDFKRFDDVANGAPARKQAQVLALGVSGNKQAIDGSATQGSFTLTLGRLQLDSTAVAADAAGLRTAGSYNKLAAQIEHQRALGDNLAASVRLSGQLAFKNLDSSEKFSLGGPQAARAYASGGAGTDDGVLASAELSRVIGGVRAKVFVDAASGRVAHKPLPTDTHNSRSLSDIGIGADAQLPAGLLLQASAATPLGGDDGLNERGPRLWLQLSRNF